MLNALKILVVTPEKAAEVPMIESAKDAPPEADARTKMRKVKNCSQKFYICLHYHPPIPSPYKTGPITCNEPPTSCAFEFSSSRKV